MTLLHNHTSPETAYVVEDYPYSFKLRCKIRYWLEFSKNKGVRFASQTTNPKVQQQVISGEYWNKPKYSTYCAFGGAMFLDEENHVQWTGLHEYQGLKETLAWMEKFSGANHPECTEKTSKWFKFKLLTDRRKSLGLLAFTVNGIAGEPLKPELDWNDEKTQNLVKDLTTNKIEV
jgi:hypothetical protein